MANQPIQKNHAAFVVDLIDIEGFAQGTVSSATNAAQSAALNEGVYDIWCDQNSFIKVATTANDVTTATGYLLRANNTISLVVRENSKIGAIMSTVAGTLSYHKVG